MPDRIADLMAWGLSEGVARRVASRDRPVGPVRDQRSDAARLEALLATRDRLAQQTPTEQLIAGIDPTLVGSRTSAAPATTLASLAGLEGSPDETSFGSNPRRWIEENVFGRTMNGPAIARRIDTTLDNTLAGVGGLIRALDRPPTTGYPKDAPYTSPLRLVSAASAALPAAAGMVYDTFAGGPRRDAPVVDPMRPPEEQATFSGEVARRGGGRIAQGFGTAADLLVGPEHGLQLLGAAAPVLMGAGKLAKVAKEAQAARALTGGFYSRVDEAAKFLPAKGVKAESLINTLKKASGGVSAEELELRGLAEFAASKRGQVVTPADLSAHLKANPAPFPTVKTLGGPSFEDVLRQHGLRSSGINYNTDLHRISDGPDAIPLTLNELKQFPQEVMDAFEGLANGETRTTAPKFSPYQVPGGENYRETLLTLPAKPSGSFENYARRYREIFDTNKTDAEIRVYWEAGHTLPETGSTTSSRDPNMFVSSHYSDDPNLVAHTRSNERTLPASTRLYRVEPKNFGDKGEWLKKHLTPEHYDQFVSERGRLFTDDLATSERFGHGAPDTNTFVVDVPADVAAAAKRSHGDGYTEFLLPEDVVSRKRAFTPSDASPAQPSRGTFLEEVQSDWHQQGKEKGYGVKTTLRDLDARINKEAEAKMREGGFSDSEIARIDINQRADLLGLRNDRLIAQEQGSVGVPDAPFKENWPDLSLKQALINEANRAPDSPGFLGFTGGKTQADRYDLSKQISQIEADRYIVAGENGWRVKADDMEGTSVPLPTHYLTDSQLADTFGKDMAKRIIERDGGVFDGLDLQVGGEGMHEFYDKLLPKRLEKIVKPFGGTVESGAISHRAVPSRPDNLEYMRGFANSGGLTTQQTPAWLARLTPEMKARILKEGLPLMGLSGVTLGSLLGAEKQQAR